MTNDSEPTTTTDDALLTPDDLVQRWKGKVAAKTLRNWRSAGTGPRFTTLGRRVLYRLEDVVAYERSQTSSSSE